LGVVGDPVFSVPSARIPMLLDGGSGSMNLLASASATSNGFMTSLATFIMTSYLDATSTVGS
jgi:hypothetical protein